tara:strand:+ start:510 stop:890 length:381 start_codon:yes stop_codon:yes gene_type:complete
MMENLKRFYINGEWVDPISDQTMLVINPATEEQIGTVALGNARDVDLAVEAASAAFDQFSQTTKMDRLDLLKSVMVITQRRLEDLAQAMRMEMGAPITMARSSNGREGGLMGLEDYLETKTLHGLD